jgi:riboflavin kinase/FMN adenylyltransferase
MIPWTTLPSVANDAAPAPPAVQDLPEPIPFTAAGSRWTPGAACAVAVGNFDGVHLGHAALAARLVAAADRLGLPAVALTFDPHPARILRPERAPEPLTTPARRAELLLALGVDAVLVQPVDRRLTALSAQDFYRGVLRGRLAARALVEGPDFRFGAGRAGDVRLLESLCAADGVALEVVAPVTAGGSPVSSSRIRELVAAGHVAAANSLLTAPFRASGTVVAGARRGAALGFPTANLGGVATLLPAVGVYAARATLHAVGGSSGHAAAVHVGPNVTFGATAVTVEAHLVGFTGDCYGARLDVDFLDRLRDTRRFDSISDLQAQLTRDVEAAWASARRDRADPGATR